MMLTDLLVQVLKQSQLAYLVRGTMTLSLLDNNNTSHIDVTSSSFYLGNLCQCHAARALSEMLKNFIKLW